MLPSRAKEPVQTLSRVGVAWPSLAGSHPACKRVRSRWHVDRIVSAVIEVATHSHRIDGLDGWAEPALVQAVGEDDLRCPREGCAGGSARNGLIHDLSFASCAPNRAIIKSHRQLNFRKFDSLHEMTAFCR